MGSNPGPLVSEVIGLSTVPQPLPNYKTYLIFGRSSSYQ